MAEVRLPFYRNLAVFVDGNWVDRTARTWLCPTALKTDGSYAITEEYGAGKVCF